MRWLLTLIAVAAGAWYVSNRRRRDRVGQTIRDAVPAPALDRSQHGATTVAGATRQTASALRPGLSGTGGLVPSAPGNDGPTTGMEQPPALDHTDVLERTSGAYVGNTRTRIFHRADSAHLPVNEHRVYFATEAEARKAAFVPAENEGLETTES